MDVVCFSFECILNDNGSQNCQTAKPTTSLAPLTTRPTSHPTLTPTTSAATSSPGKPSTTSYHTVKSTSSYPSSQKTSVVTSKKPSDLTTQQKSSIVTTSELRPSSGKPSSTPKSTWEPTSSQPSSQKSTKASTRKSSISTVTTVTLPPTGTTPVSVTTTANNSRLPIPPMPHKTSSVDSAGGESIYIPCTVAACVVVFLFVSIGIIRRRRNRRERSEDRQVLNIESECDLTLEDPPFQFNIQASYVQPITGHSDPRFTVNDNSEAEYNDANPLGFHDALETSPEDDFEGSYLKQALSVKNQRNNGGNNSGVV